MSNRHAYIPYADTGSFSKLVIDYQNRDEKLKPFINDFPSVEAIKAQIKRKEKQAVNRAALVEVLTEQYTNQGIHLEKNRVGDNITKLKEEKTFTICTAHQPNIFSGYLYFIYKIVHAINLAKECAEQIPGYNFVPVYFIGSEDNDIEEIGAFNFKNKKYQWAPNQTGACGRFSTESLTEIRDEILSQFGSSEAENKLKEQILAAYDGKKTLSEATQYFVHQLLGEYGVLAVDADDKRLKDAFKPVIKDELENLSSHRIVSEHNIKLSKDYKVQVDPRELNLFYLKDNLRERIEKDGNQWKIVNTDVSIEDLTIVELFPEHFSPNVILRPVYQEIILPNVAFIGGGSEIAYWCELKSLFTYHKTEFPILFARNSLSIVYNKLLNKISKMGFKESFEPLENALKEKSSSDPSYTQLLADLEAIENSYKKATESAQAISPNLEVSTEAQLAKIGKIHDRIKTKYRAHIKRQYEDLTNQKVEIADALFPNDKMQERNENYIELVSRFKQDIIPVLIEYQQGFEGNYLLLGF